MSSREKNNNNNIIDEVFTTRRIVAAKNTVRKRGSSWCSPELCQTDTESTFHSFICALREALNHALSHPFSRLFGNIKNGNWTIIALCAYIYSHALCDFQCTQTDADRRTRTNRRCKKNWEPLILFLSVFEFICGDDTRMIVFGWAASVSLRAARDPEKTQIYCNTIVSVNARTTTRLFSFSGCSAKSDDEFNSVWAWVYECVAHSKLWHFIALLPLCLFYDIDWINWNGLVCQFRQTHLRIEHQLRSVVGFSLHAFLFFLYWDLYRKML